MMAAAGRPGIPRAPHLSRSLAARSWTMASPADGPVAVTGVSGFTGGWMVKELVENGYNVRACLRDQGSWRGENATEYLESLGDSVTVFDGCDLFVPGSFDAAFKGCSAVFHVRGPSSPFPPSTTPPHPGSRCRWPRCWATRRRTNPPPPATWTTTPTTGASSARRTSSTPSTPPAPSRPSSTRQASRRSSTATSPKGTSGQRTTGPATPPRRSAPTRAPRSTPRRWSWPPPRTAAGPGPRSPSTRPT